MVSIRPPTMRVVYCFGLTDRKSAMEGRGMKHGNQNVKFHLRLSLLNNINSLIWIEESLRLIPNHNIVMF